MHFQIGFRRYLRTGAGVETMPAGRAHLTALLPSGSLSPLHGCACGRGGEHSRRITVTRPAYESRNIY